MWAALAVAFVTGFYGWLAARSTSDDALVLVQLSVVCGLAFAAHLTPPKRCGQLVALCVLIALCYFASLLVMVGGRRGLAPNKWSVFDPDDVTVFVSTAIVARTLDRLDLTTVQLSPTEWGNASFVIERIARRTPWYLLTSVSLDKKELMRVEDHMHYHRKVDVVDLGLNPFSVYAVRQNARSQNGFRVDCESGLLRCVAAPP